MGLIHITLALTANIVSDSNSSSCQIEHSPVLKMRLFLLLLISVVAGAIPSSQWKRQQAGNLTWYNDYHPYADHITYFKSLQATIPNNSEWVSTGTSYEGRDLYGIHLYGADGPGKPAILFHATVHAREWIATPV